MADTKYYCFCDKGCKFETLTKEQIYAAITQAANGGIGDVDTGFITTIKTINGTPLKFFVGAQSEFELLTEDQKQNLFAIITNDVTKDGLLEAIDELKTDVTELKNTVAKPVNYPVDEATNSCIVDKVGLYAITVTCGNNIQETIMLSITDFNISAVAYGYSDVLSEREYYHVSNILNQICIFPALNGTTNKYHKLTSCKLVIPY